MDVFIYRLEAIPDIGTTTPAVLFSGDVYDLVRTPQGLQRILDEASNWAEEYNMTWNTHKGKSELLLAPATRERTFSLANKPLTLAPTRTYLGVTISAQSIRADLTLHRIT